MSNINWVDYYRPENVEKRNSLKPYKIEIDNPYFGQFGEARIAGAYGEYEDVVEMLPVFKPELNPKIVKNEKFIGYKK